MSSPLLDAKSVPSLPWQRFLPHFPNEAYQSPTALRHVAESIREPCAGVLQSILTRDMPRALQPQAHALLGAASDAWNELFFQGCYGCPRIASVTELLEYIAFLRTLLEWQINTLTIYCYSRWLLRRRQEVALSNVDLIRLASPLYLGSFERCSVEPAWLEDLQSLGRREITLRRTPCELLALGSVVTVWRVMYSLPGENRPLRPRRLTDDVDIERAYQTAQRWCEAQLRRDEKASRVPGGSAAQQGSDAALTPEQGAVLWALGESYPFTVRQQDIAGMELKTLGPKPIFLSRPTISGCLQVLRDRGLACRPYGKRKGDAITEEGRKILERHRPAH